MNVRHSKNSFTQFRHSMTDPKPSISEHDSKQIPTLPLVKKDVTMVDEVRFVSEWVEVEVLGDEAEY
jgi:hypothetical protein